VITRVVTQSAPANARSWSVLLAAALILVSGAVARAQDVTEPALKAAFVYNFAKFTEWPEDVLPASAAFNACVLDDGPVADALERAVKGRLLSGRHISVQRVHVGGPLRTCHLLFVSGLKGPDVGTVVAAVRGAAVLTISDIDDFGRIGGIAHVFVENGTMRFDLNLDLARSSRLQLSSKLLSLATRVHDGTGSAQK
jgi:hypothetical protein